MANPIFTLRDAVDHLREVRFGIGQDVELSILKRASRAAYRDLIDRHKWQYAFKDHQITFSASYAAGTVVYTHSPDRKLVLTSGTWPTWAAYGTVKISSDLYEVQDRQNDTVLILDSIRNPGQNVASTAYTIFRDTYPLPDDFKRIDELVESNRVWNSCYVEPGEYLTYARHYGLNGKPFVWTLMPDPDSLGGMSIRVAGYPTTRENMLMIYQRAFKEPVLAGTETKCSVGTVSTTASTTVAGSSTTLFDQTMVDSILRLSADGTNEPTGNEGTNPFASQHRIRSVTSTTSLELYTAPSDSAAAKKYVISDPLDMDRSMLNAFLRGCEWQLALMGSSAEQQSAKNEQYMAAVRLAMESDWKHLSVRNASYAEKGRSTWADPASIDLT